LDFCYEEISFCEECAHLKFVVGGSATEDSAGEIDGCEVEDCVLS
jgi:hypothetical protein